MALQTIYTIMANCQDCYRCVRECPVKAIRISGGQARIDDALCIKCGTCVRECSQNAKIVRSDLDKAKELLAVKGMNISETSEIVGFTSPFYFDVVFKKETGMTPTDFVRSVSF